MFPGVFFREVSSHQAGAVVEGDGAWGWGAGLLPPGCSSPSPGLAPATSRGILPESFTGPCGARGTQNGSFSC